MSGSPAPDADASDSDALRTRDSPAARCPAPLRDYRNVTLGHGGGGMLTAELIEGVFQPAFANALVTCLSDSTVVPLPGTRIALTTDSYVVQPLFFPGGNIGSLAVNGTVNDLAMVGATPLYLTAGFILEEGLPIEVLRQIAQEMGRAAREAGVSIVAGDTKVVQRGQEDGCYINTSGVGSIPTDCQLSVDQACEGDAVLISGEIGNHGMAIMSEREGLQFESPIRSDVAALNELVQQLLASAPETRAMRDPTRGGLAGCLNEIATASRCGIEIDESAVPVDESVRAACEFLGLDPMQVANEGKLVAIVPASSAEQALVAMQSHPLGRRAAIIGSVIADPHHLVVARTLVGANRIVPMPLGEQLPRIC
ncbi:MAG: hydrogenase expression/formation protein HypE [Planctomycetota bacterium]